MGNVRLRDVWHVHVTTRMPNSPLEGGRGVLPHLVQPRNLPLKRLGEGGKTSSIELFTATNNVNSG